MFLSRTTLIICAIILVIAFAVGCNFSLNKDRVEALCQKGNVKSCEKMFEFSIEARHYERANIFLQKLCELGQKETCHGLGIYLERSGRTKIANELYQEHLSWSKLKRNELIRACKAGNPDLCQNAGGLFLQLSFAKSNKDNPKIRQLLRNALWAFTRACKLGRSESCFNLGLHFSNEEKRVASQKHHGQPFSSKEWLSKGVFFLNLGCKLENRDACVALGSTAIKLGNKKAALFGFSQACRQGYPPACEKLTQFKLNSKKKNVPANKKSPGQKVRRSTGKSR